MARWLGPTLRVLLWLSGMAVAGGSVAQAQSAVGNAAELIGIWRGTSICADRVAAPACHDETVVYEFTAGSEPGTVHWVADKVVNGQRERMGELELVFDKAEACWKAEFGSSRVRVVWRLLVNGSRLSGTGRQLPGNETIRKMDLRKDERRHRARSRS